MSVSKKSKRGQFESWASKQTKGFSRQAINKAFKSVPNGVMSNTIWVCKKAGTIKQSKEDPQQFTWCGKFENTLPAEHAADKELLIAPVPTEILPRLSMEAENAMATFSTAILKSEQIKQENQLLRKSLAEALILLTQANSLLK